MKNITIPLAILCSLFPVGVLAEGVTISWSNPDRTFNMVDAGPYTNPAGTKIYLEVANIIDSAAETVVLPDMKPGMYRFVAVSYDDKGESSPVSSAAEKVVTEWAVTNIVVKIVSKVPGGFLLLGVGTVPLGTPCDVTEELKGHYAIPQDAVVWSDPARNAGTSPLPLVVVAKCG